MKEVARKVIEKIYFDNERNKDLIHLRSKILGGSDEGYGDEVQQLHHAFEQDRENAKEAYHSFRASM